MGIDYGRGQDRLSGSWRGQLRHVLHVEVAQVDQYLEDRRKESGHQD
jgi:hypothetical protein